MSYTRCFLTMTLALGLLVIGASGCGDDDTTPAVDSGVTRFDSGGGTTDSGPDVDTGTTPYDSGGGEVDSGGTGVDSGSGGMCAGAGESCAGGRACCRMLNCCAGVPVPPGEEYCARDCPIEM